MFMQHIRRVRLMDKVREAITIGEVNTQDNRAS